MVRAHAHHILFKAGLGQRQRELVGEGMEILLKHGIDPIKGLENLVWAPNVTGQHTLKALQRVVDLLKSADRGGRGSRADIVEALQRLGREAGRR